MAPRQRANKVLADVLAAADEKWCLKSTARDLSLIATRQQKRQRDVGWITALAATLEEAAQP